jgi:P-type Cu+ transporter
MSTIVEQPGARVRLEIEGMTCASCATRPVLLTGDNEPTARAVAASVDIAQLHADVQPDGKVPAIRAPQAQGRVVAMVGDGVNAIRLARRSLKTIKANLFWAFAYNAAAVPLSMAGLLDPIVAAATMARSSVFVLSNSLRRRHFTSARATTKRGAA